MLYLCYIIILFLLYCIYEIIYISFISVLLLCCIYLYICFYFKLFCHYDILNGSSQKIVDNRRKRYIERLLQYKVTGRYIKGKTNDIADWLSHLHFET